MKTLVILGALLSGVSVSAIASEYDFDWDDKNDMRGAWMACATTGFTQGDCPKVFQKCWQPPMTYRKNHKTKTFCTDPPSFSVSNSDNQRYQDEASKRAQALNGE